MFLLFHFYYYIIFNTSLGTYIALSGNIESQPTQLRIYQDKNISLGSPEFPYQNLRQIGSGVLELWSDVRANKKKNSDT